MSPFTYNVKKRQIVETESRLVGAGGWGRELGSDCLMGPGFLFQVSRVLELEHGDGRTTLNVLEATELYTLNR